MFCCNLNTSLHLEYRDSKVIPWRDFCSKGSFAVYQCGKYSSSSTASSSLYDTRRDTATGKKVSGDKNNDNKVIFYDKITPAKPQPARRKSRIFEDLPKLFETTVCEDENLRDATHLQETPSQELSQEGTIVSIYHLYGDI